MLNIICIFFTHVVLITLLIFILITQLFLVSDKVKDAREHDVALFALVLHVAGSDVSFIGQLFLLIVFGICLVFITLTSFLAGILEPHHNDSGW